MNRYRMLEQGEKIQEGDEVEICPDPWRDEPDWQPTECAGKVAPDPQYIAHRKYRRRVFACCDCGKQFDTLPPPADTSPDDPAPRCSDCIEAMLDGIDAPPLTEAQVERIMSKVNATPGN